MGTRSLTVFKDEHNKEICVLYRQYDGYVDGHGQDLFTLLKDKVLTNGLSGNTSLNYNGMHCLAASVIAHFKKEPGQFYLYSAGTNDVGEEYKYILYPDDKTICLMIQTVSLSDGTCTTLYNGPVSELNIENIVQQ